MKAFWELSPYWAFCLCCIVPWLVASIALYNGVKYGRMTGKGTWGNIAEEYDEVLDGEVLE